MTIWKQTNLEKKLFYLLLITAVRGQTQGFLKDEPLEGGFPSPAQDMLEIFFLHYGG